MAPGCWAWSVVANGLGLVVRPWVPLALVPGLARAPVVVANPVARPGPGRGADPAGEALQAE